MRGRLLARLRRRRRLLRLLLALGALALGLWAAYLELVAAAAAAGGGAPPDRSELPRGAPGEGKAGGGAASQPGAVPGSRGRCVSRSGARCSAPRFQAGRGGGGERSPVPRRAAERCRRSGSGFPGSPRGRGWVLFPGKEMGVGSLFCLWPVGSHPPLCQETCQNVTLLELKSPEPRR